MVAQLEPQGISWTIETLQAVANHLTVPTHTPQVIAPKEYQEIVDEALQLVYAQHHRIISRLFPGAVTRINTEQLREGPLGGDLMRLAQIAAGGMRADQEAVFGAIDAVLQLLFWPVGSEDYAVPRSFWEQPLGKMLSLAKLRTCEPSDLMSIGQAARVLNVTRSTIYRWMDDKSLDYVRDDMSGRTFVMQRDVEAMKADMEEYATIDPDLDMPETAFRPLKESLLEQALNSLDSVIRLSEELDELAEVEEGEEATRTEEHAERIREALAVDVTNSIPSVRVRVEEEPLTASTLNTLTSVVTSLHTKLWLMHQGRFADLINYAQSRDARFDREANLRILTLSYNSPLDIKLDVGLDKIGDAFQKSIDAFGQTGLRYKEQSLKNEALAVENRLRDSQAQAVLADQEEARHIARERANLDAEKARLEIERERLALQREQLQLEYDRVTLATQAAMIIVGTVYPDATDPMLRATLAQTIIPELLQGGTIQGLRLVLPVYVPQKAGDAGGGEQNI